MNYITITAFCKTLMHGQRVNPFKLHQELKLAHEYGLKYIYIKNSDKTAKFEVDRVIQLLEDWNASNQRILLIDFPEDSKGMNFKRI